MKHLFIILLSFLAVVASAETYYVAPTTATPAGNNANAGTLAAPWATLDYAFDRVSAGDTVFLRGGIYYQSSAAWRSNLSGTATDYIVFMAYPSDLSAGNRPILDGNSTSNDGGIFCSGSNYLKFYGLEIRNFVQINQPVGASYDTPYGFYIYRSSNIVIENCIVHHIQYRPFWIWESDEIYLINCDSYDIYDPLSDDPGDHADAFFVWDGAGVSYPNYRVYLWGCRAWNFADNGYDIQGDFYIEAKNCWAFNGGHIPGFQYGRGSGFAYGYPEGQQTFVTREINNCIAAFNNTAGFVTMDWSASSLRYQEIYNNTSYHNGYPTDAVATGFTIFNTTTSDANELQRVFRNNIAYANETYEISVAIGALYTHSNNSWDAAVTITDADFVSVDSTGITAARQADGSLPDNDCYNYFLKLADGSDLIDAGIDVGLDYTYTAPDIGAFEYDPDSTLTDILTFTLADQTGAATINTTNHTVAIEIAYTADITSLTPTITLSYGATINPLSGVSQNFTSPVTYTVTALDGTTTQEWVVTVTKSAEPPAPAGDSSIVKYRGLIFKL